MRKQIEMSAPTYSNYYALYYGYSGGTRFKPTADAFKRVAADDSDGPNPIAKHLVSLARQLQGLESDFSILGYELGLM